MRRKQNKESSKIFGTQWVLLYDDHIKSNILVCMYEYIWNEPVFADSVAQTSRFETIACHDAPLQH